MVCFFERMHALRPFENVLMDLYDDALHMACALHIDRAGVMTYGTPDDVKRAVHTAAEAFDVKNGGAFFYVETDNGFPLENIRALLETIGEYRTEEKYLFRRIPILKKFLIRNMWTSGEYAGVLRDFTGSA